MPLNVRNHAFLALALSALVAGCAGEETAEAEPATTSDAAPDTASSSENMEMAQTAWLTVSEDGEVFTTYLDADGRYRDKRRGEIVYGGTWEQSGSDELCFTPDAGTGGCWTHKSPGLDGVMRATDADGRAIEVKKVTYTAPETLPVLSSDKDDEALLDDIAQSGRG